VSLSKRLADIPEPEPKDVVELRKALLRAQKTIADLKRNKEDFTQAVVNAAHDAMLSHGAVAPVANPVKDSRKSVARLRYYIRQIGN